MGNCFNAYADFKDDPDIYVFPKLRYVGIELWQVTMFVHVLYLLLLPMGFERKKLRYKVYTFFQVKSGTLFDNVLLTDDPTYAKKLAEETWGKHKEVCCSLLLRPFLNLTYHTF